MSKGSKKRGSVLAVRIAAWKDDAPKSKTKMHKPGSQQTERKSIGRAIRGTSNANG